MLAGQLTKIVMNKRYDMKKKTGEMTRKRKIIDKRNWRRNSGHKGLEMVKKKYSRMGRLHEIF